mgnify:CR=1 FL=1
MEEMRTINLDKYDYRLILNALNEFRNIKIQENVDIEIIDKLMSKLLKAPVNKKMLSLNRTAKGKFTSNEARWKKNNESVVCNRNYSNYLDCSPFSSLY